MELSPGDALALQLAGRPVHAVHHRQHRLQYPHQQQDLQRQVERVFPGAGGHVVDVAFTVEHGAPQRAEEHILDIGDELDQNNAPDGDFLAVEKEGVDDTAFANAPPIFPQPINPNLYILCLLSYMAIAFYNIFINIQLIKPHRSASVKLLG